MRNFITVDDHVLHVHQPRVVVETAVAQGADRVALFANSGLSAGMLTSPEMRISYFQYGVLATNAMALTGDPGLGLRVGKNTGVGQIGLLGILLPNCRTIGDALDAVLRYARAVTPMWEFDLQRRGQTGILMCRQTLPLGHLTQFAHEAMLATIDTQARELYGKPAPIRRLELPFPKPPHARRYRDALHGVPVAFDCDVARIVFDLETLAHKIPFANSGSYVLAEHYSSKLLDAAAGHGGLLARVRHLLSSEPSTPPSLSQVASKLRTSTRTLRRELRKMHTSYSALLDEVRQAHVSELLSSTRAVPSERLARNLGFSNVSSFRRAQRRWTRAAAARGE